MQPRTITFQAGTGVDTQILMTRGRPALHEDEASFNETVKDMFTNTLKFK